MLMMTEILMPKTHHPLPANASSSGVIICVRLWCMHIVMCHAQIRHAPGPGQRLQKLMKCRPLPICIWTPVKQLRWIKWLLTMTDVSLCWILYWRLISSVLWLGWCHRNPILLYAPFQQSLKLLIRQLYHRFQPSELYHERSCCVKGTNCRSRGEHKTSAAESTLGSLSIRSFNC